MTTFILSMFNAELVRGTGLPVVFGVALMYGGIAQILAGMWEFRAGNTFGATALTSFGAFWLSYWALVQFYLGDIVKAGAAGKAVGLYLIAWGIFSLYMFVATFRINVGLVVVFGLLVITFALLGIGQARSYRSRPGPGSGAAADRGPPFLGAGRRRAPRRAARRERHRDHRPALREARLGPRSTRPGVSSTPYLMTFALDSVGDVFGSIFLSVAGMLVMKIGVLALDLRRHPALASRLLRRRRHRHLGPGPRPHRVPALSDLRPCQQRCVVQARRRRSTHQGIQSRRRQTGIRGRTL